MSRRLRMTMRFFSTLYGSVFASVLLITAVSFAYAQDTTEATSVDSADGTAACDTTQRPFKYTQQYASYRHVLEQPDGNGGCESTPEQSARSLQCTAFPDETDAMVECIKEKAGNYNDPNDYVRICPSTNGEIFYIPGDETCGQYQSEGGQGPGQDQVNEALESVQSSGNSGNAAGTDASTGIEEAPDGTGGSTESSTGDTSSVESTNSGNGAAQASDTNRDGVMPVETLTQCLTRGCEQLDGAEITDGATVLPATPACTENCGVESGTSNPSINTQQDTPQQTENVEGTEPSANNNEGLGRLLNSLLSRSSNSGTDAQGGLTPAGKPDLGGGGVSDTLEDNPPLEPTTVEQVGEFLQLVNRELNPLYVPSAAADPKLEKYQGGLWPAPSDQAGRHDLARNTINNVYGMKRSNEFLKILEQNPNIQLQPNQTYLYAGFASHADAVAALLEKFAKQSAYANCNDYACILSKYIGDDDANGKARYDLHLKRTGLDPKHPSPRVNPGVDLESEAELILGISRGEYRFNEDSEFGTNPLTREVIRDAFAKVYSKEKAEAWYKGTSIGAATDNTVKALEPKSSEVTDDVNNSNTKPNTGNKALDAFVSANKGFKLGTADSDAPNVSPKEAAKLAATELSKLKVYSVDDEPLGTFTEYVSQQISAAETVLENDAYAQQINEKVGAGHTVEGAGHQREVKKQEATTGTLNLTTEEQARIIDAASKNGIAAKVTGDGSVQDGSGNTLTLEKIKIVDPLQDELIVAARSKGGTPQIPGAGETTYDFPLAEEPCEYATFLALHNSGGHVGSGVGTARSQAQAGHGSIGTAWWYSKGTGPLLSRPECSVSGHIGINSPTLPGVADIGNGRGPRCPKSKCKNSNTIGIEFEGFGKDYEDLTNEEKEQIRNFIKFIQERYNITPDRILCHCKDNGKEANAIWRIAQEMNYQPGEGSSVYQLNSTDSEGNITKVGETIQNYKLPNKGSAVYTPADGGKAITLAEAKTGSVSITPEVTEDGISLKYNYTPPPEPEKQVQETSTNRTTTNRGFNQTMQQGFDRLGSLFSGLGGGSGSSGGSSTESEPSSSDDPRFDSPSPVRASLSCELEDKFVTGKTADVQTSWSCDYANRSMGLTSNDGMTTTLDTDNKVFGNKIIQIPVSSTQTIQLGIRCMNEENKVAENTCRVAVTKPQLSFFAVPDTLNGFNQTQLVWASTDLSLGPNDGLTCTIFGPDQTVLSESELNGALDIENIAQSTQYLLMCDTQEQPIFASDLVIVNEETSDIVTVDLPFISIATSTGAVEVEPVPANAEASLCHPRLGTQRFRECITN